MEYKESYQMEDAAIRPNPWKHAAPYREESAQSPVQKKQKLFHSNVAIVIDKPTITLAELQSTDRGTKRNRSEEMSPNGLFRPIPQTGGFSGVGTLDTLKPKHRYHAAKGDSIKLEDDLANLAKDVDVNKTIQDIEEWFKRSRKVHGFNCTITFVEDLHSYTMAKSVIYKMYLSDAGRQFFIKHKLFDKVVEYLKDVERARDTYFY